MYSCQCIGPCHLAEKKWDSTEARVNTITIKSDTYCAFECDYHPHFCTHWARSRNKCILYFGDIHEPSPDIVLASALKNKKRSSHKVGGALRGLTMTSSDLETGRS